MFSRDKMLAKEPRVITRQSPVEKSDVEWSDDHAGMTCRNRRLDELIYDCANAERSALLRGSPSPRYLPT